MVLDVKLKGNKGKGKYNLKPEQEAQKIKAVETNPAPPHGVIYSKRLNFTPFATPPLQEYASILGKERMERLLHAA